MEWDIFISHAHEDKEIIVRPLAHRLAHYGVKVWFDEFSLRLGDPLRASLDRGLSSSRFGVIVLSQAFFEKKWTSFELDSLIHREQPGTKLILPLWFGIDAADLKILCPSLADKIALRVEGKPESLENAALQILQEVRPDLFGRLARRRALLEELATTQLEGIKVNDIERVIVPDNRPIFQEKLGVDLLSRIRLVCACLKEVYPTEVEDWFRDFRCEPFPYQEIRIWEYIAAVYKEVIGACSLKLIHRRLVFRVLLETTFFVDDLTEPHARLLRVLPTRARLILQERMGIKPPFEEWEAVGPKEITRTPTKERQKVASH